MANLFEPNIFPQILGHLPIGDILHTCSGGLSRQYQSLCKDQPLWRRLLYRDYGTFSPLLRELERESYMSYLDLYREFYTNPFFNSPDFRSIYRLLLDYVPLPLFQDENGNDSPIPQAVTRPLITATGTQPLSGLQIKVPQGYAMDIADKLYDIGYPLSLFQPIGASQYIKLQLRFSNNRPAIEFPKKNMPQNINFITVV